MIQSTTEMITPQTGTLISVPPTQHSTSNTLATTGIAAITLAALLTVGILLWRRRKTASLSISQTTTLRAGTRSAVTLTTELPNPAVLIVSGGGGLVVVDMQPNFSAANDTNTIAAVKMEILDAQRAGDFIFVLEYAGEGRTHSELMDLIESYPWHEVLSKSYNDGSAEVESACNRQGLNPSYLRVVGVNSDACVKETVAGLSRRFSQSQVLVVRNACNSFCTYDWSKFPSAPNIVLH